MRYPSSRSAAKSAESAISDYFLLPQKTAFPKCLKTNASLYTRACNDDDDDSVAVVRGLSSERTEPQLRVSPVLNTPKAGRRHWL